MTLIDKTCSNCAEARKERGESPQPLVALKGHTIKKNLVVRVCPDCDGDTLKIAGEQQ